MKITTLVDVIGLAVSIFVGESTLVEPLQSTAGRHVVRIFSVNRFNTLPRKPLQPSAGDIQGYQSIRYNDIPTPLWLRGYG